MNILRIFTISFIIVLIGFLLIFAGILLSTRTIDKSVSGGFILLIGPIPIIGGFGPHSTLLIIIAFVIMIILIIIMLVFRPKSYSGAVYA